MARRIKMDDEWTVRDAADEWDKSPDTVYRWIAEGRVRAVRVGPTSRVRIPAEEVDRVRRQRCDA